MTFKKCLRVMAPGVIVGASAPASPRANWRKSRRLERRLPGALGDDGELHRRGSQRPLVTVTRRSLQVARRWS